MEILNLIPYAYQNLIIFLFSFTRITFLFTTFVLFRKEYVNGKFIIALSSILSFYAVTLNKLPMPQYEIFSIAMNLELMKQALIGFVSGLILNVSFEVFTAVGQIISTQVGFSIATLIDPRFGVITPLTFFYHYLSMVLFLMLNGHLILIQLIMDSFSSMPIGGSVFLFNHLNEVIFYAKNIFSYSVSLSITLIITMLLTNITVAVMTRFAPQFNIFSVGINITMIGGLIFVYLTFGLFIDNGQYIFEHVFSFLKSMLLR